MPTNILLNQKLKASSWGVRGRRFKSSRADQNIPPKEKAHNLWAFFVPVRWQPKIQLSNLIWIVSLAFVSFANADSFHLTCTPH